MLSYDEAVQVIEESVVLRDKAVRPLGECTGAVLAEPVTAPFDIPRYTNSAMDGFAVCAADTAGASAPHPVYLEIRETVGAGNTPAFTVTPGYCSAIMTGAALPA